MKPTLLILAAGIGSRYGGFKQIDQLGPSNETLMDYSIYDAIKAGFGKVVFTINKNIEKEFNHWFIPRFNNQINIDYVLQETDIIPDEIPVNPKRIKPWGTGHALLVAAPKIHESFAMINADDYYGAGIYKLMVSHLIKSNCKNYFLAGYKLKNTLSGFGEVSRAIGTKNNYEYLTSLKENKRIERTNDGIFSISNNNTKAELSGESIASMNFFGFTPSIFKYLEESFKIFLKKNSNELTTEFLLPDVINEIIKSGKERIEVLKTDSKWFGITYKEDKVIAKRNIQDYINMGVYPHNLWNS